MGQTVFRGLLSLACGLILSPIANADVLNFTSGGASWFHGAYFNSNINQAGGNGLLDPFVELSGSKGDITYAYNSDGPVLPAMESTNSTAKNNAIQVKDIPVAVGTDGRLYFEFLLDVNEPGAAKSLISLDDLRVYSQSIAAGGGPNPVVTNPDSLGTLQYALGGAGSSWTGLASPGNPNATNNHVLLDYSRYSGSGVADLMVYVPVWIPSATIDSLKLNTDYVYLYSALGAYSSAFKQDANDDNWGLRENNAPPTDIPIEPQGGVVPEPTSLALAGFAGIGFALRALRRRRSSVADQAA